MGLQKIEKSMSQEQREEVKKRKLEYVKQLVLMKKQEEENRRINEEAEMWSKQMESLISNGYTREMAESIMENNRKAEEKRAEKKKAKEERKLSKKG